MGKAETGKLCIILIKNSGAKLIFREKRNKIVISTNAQTTALIIL